MIIQDLQEAIQKVVFEDDQAAFEKIYKGYYSRLFRLALSVVKSEDLANEVYDDVMLNVWQKRRNLAHVNNFTVYLYVSVKNASLRQLSKQGKISYIRIDEDFDIQDTTPTMQEEMMSLELLAIINQSIAGLSPQCKQVFKLVKEDGLKYKEVAEILNVSVKNVEYHMGNALKKISENISNNKKPVAQDALKSIIFN
jgi:RNA polymerase sigma-70 factor (family 1)